MRDSNGPPNVVLTDRDLDLLERLLESRVMTTRQITALCFANKSAYAYKRLAVLNDSGMIATRDRVSAAFPHHFYLTKSGFDRLTASRRIRPKITWPEMDRRLRKLSDQFLAHELAVIDAVVSLQMAIRGIHTSRITRCSTWPRRHGFDAIGTDGVVRPMRPDAFLQIVTGEGEDAFSRDFFIELDRSEEVLAELVDKALRYRWYINSGHYARDFCGVPVDEIQSIDVQEFHFTVLIIVPSDARRNNIAERLLTMSQPIKQLVWLTTMTEVRENPLGRIWVRPKDLLVATRGGPFDPHARRSHTDHARDQSLARSIQKWALLDEPE